MAIIFSPLLKQRSFKLGKSTLNRRLPAHETPRQRHPSSRGGPMSIETRFDIPFIATMALREKQIQQN
jgi:hypothetical protein